MAQELTISCISTILKQACRWETLAPHQIVASLEDGSLLNPSLQMLSNLLRACKSERNPDLALRLHAVIHTCGLQTREAVGNQLVSVLVQLGCVGIAQQVFDGLVYRRMSSWNSLIAGHLWSGNALHAISVYEKMYEVGIQPSDHLLDALLKACASLKDTESGCRIHNHITCVSLEGTWPSISCVLVYMYAKSGSQSDARIVFDNLLMKGVVLWTVIIAGYVEYGDGEKALECYEMMHLDGFFPDVITLTCVVKACASLHNSDKGKEIHSVISIQGLEMDPMVICSVINMYASCGMMEEMQETFDRMEGKDVAAWTALIAGYTEHGDGRKALTSLEQMQHMGIFPNNVTFICSLKACGMIRTIEKGQEMHAEIARKGLSERYQILNNALVDMYAKCGHIRKAKEVFRNVTIQDVVPWNALIAGYVNQHRGIEAFDCYVQMQEESVLPDVITLVYILKACGILGMVENGYKIHFEMVGRGFFGITLVGNALTRMYIKCGLLTEAQEVFKQLQNKDVISYNALLLGYIEYGHNQEVLMSYMQMKASGITSDAVTYLCVLKACGRMGAISNGENFHREIIKENLLDRDLNIGNALVNMYAMCGLLGRAQRLFDELPCRDIITWTTLVAGYAQVGDADTAVYAFEEMRRGGTKPNAITFVEILTACNHAGALEICELYFEMMTIEYGINPSLEHITCLLDLFGRSGQLRKAMMLIKTMPFHPDLVIWHTMLGACQKWGDIDLGKQMFQHAIFLDEHNSGSYIIMSNVHMDVSEI